MNSPKLINYELRPAKFTERKMLLSSLINICRYYDFDYQYIGLGGVSFTDFKLFHKELHIDEMHSIEGGDNLKRKRIEFNIPFSCIKTHFGLSSNVLPNLNLDKKTIVWLDYDGDLDLYMFDDIAILFNKLPKGSVYIITCNRQLKDRDTGKEYSEDSFRERFNSLAPIGLNNKSFNGENNYTTIRQMLLNSINSKLKQRARYDDNLKFHQLFNFIYSENRGAPMYSFGGIIEDDSFKLEDYNLEIFDFVKTGAEAYRIKIPNITHKETQLIDSNINSESEIDFDIIEENDVKNYIKGYRYLPTFMDVRL